MILLYLVKNKFTVKLNAVLHQKQPYLAPVNAFSVSGALHLEEWTLSCVSVDPNFARLAVTDQYNTAHDCSTEPS
jgi:hypothetical protein